MNGPFFPPLEPTILPQQPFDRMIKQYGINLLWRKSHACPCINGGQVPGSPDPRCRTCQGRGVYWDAPSAPFRGILTWRHMSPSPDEFGARVNETVGLLQHGEPAITVPFTADSDGTIWTQASEYDAFIEIDAAARFSANLSVSGITAVPYQQGLTIAATGAVTTFNVATSSVVVVTGYTVSGATVLMPPSYPQDTAYTVEFTAAPAFVALRPAGALPQARPFGGNINRLPRRFRVQTLDLWTRARQYPGSSSPQGL